MSSPKGRNKIILFFIEFLLFSGIVCAFTLEFDPGWNLKSIPVDIPDKTPAWLCGQVNCSSILAYYGDRWLSYNPNRRHHMNTLHEINESMGLWVNVDKAQELDLDGQLRDISITYNKGWNLVGYPGLAPQDIEDIYDVSEVRSVLMFNRTWSAYPSSGLERLTPGFGYWVEAKKGFVITYNAGSPPVIDMVEILPDDSPDPGVQVMPVMDGVKEVRVNAQVTDADGVDDILSVTALTPKGLLELPKMNDIDSDTANYSAVFYMDYSDPAGDYHVEVNASDSLVTVSSDAVFEYLELIGLELDTSNLNFGLLQAGGTGNLDGDTDMGTESPTIKNTGNAVIDVEISGQDLTGDTGTITVDNLRYRFDEGEYNVLTGDPSAIDLDLLIDSVNKVDFEITIPPAVPAEDYTGSVTITAKK